MHQIRICPLHYQYQEYAELLFEELSQAGIPCRLDPWQAHGAALAAGANVVHGNTRIALIGEREYESDVITLLNGNGREPLELSGEELIRRFSRR
jgi:threonyl-tRNA synthetase